MSIEPDVVRSCIQQIIETQDSEIILKCMLILSCFDEKFVICSSNAALLINANGFNFSEMHLKGIRLSNTDLSGGNFVRANLENSFLRRVKIS